MNDTLRVACVPSAAVRPLRGRVLRRRRSRRPGAPRAESRFDQDDAPPTRHLAAMADGRTAVGCLSVFDEACPGEAARGRRLRGMAVDPEARGRGVGRRLLAALAAYEDPGALWCNARASAAGFYQATGWTLTGDPFEISGIGTHRRAVWTHPAYGPASDAGALPIPDLGLACPGCRYAVTGLPQHACPECGCAFEPDDLLPPGGAPLLFVDGQEVKTTPWVTGLLNRYHLPWVEQGSAFESLLSGPGGVFADAASPLRVPRTFYLQAVDLLQRATRGDPPPAPPLAAASADWPCPGCGEENPGTFALCWSCGEPGAPDKPT